MSCPTDYETGRDFDDFYFNDGGTTTMETPLYPQVQVQLDGEDGNAFDIIGRCLKAARRASIGAGPIAAFQVEAMNGDYDHLLATCMKWFDVS
jgi:hypothetical protein